MTALDLDNTIICYDEAFRSAAIRLDCLPDGTSFSKAQIKASALAKGGNELWTRLQGLAYGEEITKASLFPGCVEFASAASRGELAILSHKTIFPVIGPRINLRQAALDFLAGTPLGEIPVYFFATREEKVAKLADLRPRALIDDLAEVFETPGFPSETIFHLFDPENARPDWTASPRLRSWHEARHLLIDAPVE